MASKPRKNIIEKEIGKTRIVIVGTAHVSRESVEQVKRVIEQEEPDIVAIELDRDRYHALRQGNKWRETNLWDVIRHGKTGLFLASIILSAYQKRLGEKLGVKPGEEMLAAARTAGRVGARIELVDKPLGETLSRAWKNASMKEKLLVLVGMVEALFGSEEPLEEEIEALKDTDVLSAVLEEFGRISPGIKRALVDERDEHIAARVYNLARELHEGRIVLVVGAGHAGGIARRLEAWKKKKMEKVPVPETPGITRRKTRVHHLIVPALFVLILAWALYTGGTQKAVSTLSTWVLYNSVFAALGALLAGGHPLTILVAGLSAPLTSLNPSLAAGWFAGLAELFVRQPRVRDFEELAHIKRLRDIWKNRVSRVLLVVVFTNLGSTLGTIIALWAMAGG